jgi:hypothetical protein
MARPSATTTRLEGGHTFSIATPSGGASAACGPCHGDTDPGGTRDWDGDGLEGRLAAEHDRALGRAGARLVQRITAARIVDRCGRRAADVSERDARLHLVDRRGTLLGDCDADGELTAEEDAPRVGALPPPLADAAWDLAMLRADGSRGAHNPRYAFHVLAAVERALE